MPPRSPVGARLWPASERLIAGKKLPRSVIDVEALRTSIGETAGRLADDPALAPDTERGTPPVSAIGARCAAQAQHEPSYVLFVDDDDANLEVWEASCEGEFKVLTASSAEQALVLLGQHE